MVSVHYCPLTLVRYQARFLGAWQRWRRPVFLVCQAPAVCLSPLHSCLLDRCQSLTPGLSTLNPHTHRGNCSLGGCLLSLCSTIYHQSVHRHLSSSPLHPDITGLRGLNPQVLQLPKSLLNPFLSSCPPSSLPPPSSVSSPCRGSLTIPRQSAFIRSLWWKPIVTKVSCCQPQRPFRGPAVCTPCSSPPLYHLPLSISPPPFVVFIVLLESQTHLCYFCLQLRLCQTLMLPFSAAVHFYLCQWLLISPLSKLLQMSFFMGGGCFSHYNNTCSKWAPHAD